MSKEKSKLSREPNSWTTLRRHLASLGKPALIALVKDLYEVSAGNRDFIQAHCRAGESAGEILEKYRAKIVEQFCPARGEPRLRLSEARKAISDYRRATGDVLGTAELLMTYVEQGAEFTHEYGDIEWRFYNSVESALDELAALLRKEARGMYQQLRQRLERVEQITDGIGWGFHDYIGDVVWQLDEELGDQ